MTKKNIVTLTEGSSFTKTNVGIDVTKCPSPNDRATLIMFMAIDIVKLAIAGIFAGPNLFCDCCHHQLRTKRS